MTEEPKKKSLLIIKANPTGLVNVENFLKNREWKIKSTSNLKEAMIFLVQEQPQFVMVSSNHPNKKVRNLPKILAQAFPVCVIAFAEESNAQSLKTLSAAASEYLIYPPVTGPAVERTVNKYYKDQLAKPLQQINRLGLGKDDSNQTISIRGGEANNQVIGGQSFTSNASAASVLAQLLGDDAHSSFNIGEGSSENSPGYMPNHGDDTEKSNADYFGQMNPAKTAGGAIAETNDGDDTGDLEGALNGALRSNKPAYGGGPGHSSAPLSANSGSVKPQDPGMASEGIGAGDKLAATYDPDPYGDGKSSSYRPDRKKDSSWVPLPNEKGSQNQRPGSESDLNNDTRKSDSIILRGTTEALEQSCVRGAASYEAPIEQSSNVACIVIESSRFSGYLIAAMGKNKIIDSAFIANVREKLFKFLKSNGEKIQEQETMNINIKQVPFEDWAVEYAEFLRKSIHEGNEVAMAFFPRADINAKFEESADKEMAALNIEDLAPDTRVEFNLYVYLPRNGKYILYTPKGGIFYGHQKDRLMKQNVRNLHLLKVDIQDLDKYRAQNYLNEKIDQFENKKRIADMINHPANEARPKKTA